MLMSDDKKKMATLIVGKMGKKPDEPTETPQKDGAEQDASMPLEAAADEIMSAFEQKSPKALVEALKSFMELCESMKGDEKTEY